MLSSLQGSSSHLQGHQQNHEQQQHQQPSKFLHPVLESTVSSRDCKSPWFGGQGGFISVNFVQFVLNSINLETKQVEALARP